MHFDTSLRVSHAQDDDGLTEGKGQAFCGAVKYTAVCLFASALVVGLCYFFVRAMLWPKPPFPAPFCLRI